MEECTNGVALGFLLRAAAACGLRDDFRAWSVPSALLIERNGKPAGEVGLVIRRVWIPHVGVLHVGQDDRILKVVEVCVQDDIGWDQQGLSVR